MKHYLLIRKYLIILGIFLISTLSNANLAQAGAYYPDEMHIVLGVIEQVPSITPGTTVTIKFLKDNKAKVTYESLDGDVQSEIIRLRSNPFNNPVTETEKK